MIPEEVAEIGILLRNELPDLDYNKSVDIAWKIFRIVELYEKAHLQGSY